MHSLGNELLILAELEELVDRSVPVKGILVLKLKVFISFHPAPHMVPHNRTCRFPTIHLINATCIPREVVKFVQKLKRLFISTFDRSVLPVSRWGS